MNMRIPAFALAMALALPAQAAEIVALGASNTEGRGRGAHADGVPRGQAFPAQLEGMLRAEGCNVRVKNAGKAGDTTGGMLARLNGALDANTRVLILQPGGNDARQGEGGDRSANIAAIRQKAAARNVTVIMMENSDLGRARAYRASDGQHFTAPGHTIFAQNLLPEVKATGVCRK